MITATNMIGIINLAVATLRAKIMPKMAAVLLLFGGIEFNLPPMPALHIVLVAGGILWGGGAAWLGKALMEKKNDFLRKYEFNVKVTVNINNRHFSALGRT